MQFPPFLKPGDKIGIVAPAGKIEPSVIDETERFISNAGYVPLFGENILKRNNLFAGSDEERLSDFNKMIHNVDIKAIWCARGGYGSMRIIDKIDFEHLVKRPKWIIGFSDITVFHSYISSNTDLVTIHGEMPNSFPNNIGANKVVNILQGNMAVAPILPHILNKKGVAKGKLIGGNLTIIHNLIGTNLDFSSEGKILFIEEIGEYDYHLDRMIQSMKLAGKFDKLAGLIVGQISDTKDGATPYGMSAYEIVNNALKEYDFPIIYNFPSGHSNPNYPLLLNSEIEIEVEKNRVIFKYKNLNNG